LKSDAAEGGDPTFGALNIHYMKKNMGIFDRVTRTISAAVAIYLYATNIVGGTLGVLIVVVAVIFLLTSFVGVCPLYLPFGLSTLRKKATHTP